MLGTLLLNSLSIGSVYALVALGYSLIYATSSLLNFALGDIAMVGAFVGVTAMVGLKLPFPLAAIAGVGAAALLSLGMERFLIRPIQRSGGPAINPLICTLGLAIVLRNGALRIFGPEAQVMPSAFSDTFYQIGSLRVAPQYVFIAAAGLVLMLALHLFLAYTRPGRAMRAVAQDRRAAALMGVDVNQSIALAFALSGAIGGSAGVLLAPVLFVTPTMGALLGLKGFVAAVVGGLGHLQGAIVGGLLLGAVETLGAGVLKSGYRDAITFVVLILMLWLRPGGILLRRTVEKL